MGINIGRVLGNAAKGFINYATPIGIQTQIAGTVAGKPGIKATDLALPYAETGGAAALTALGVPPMFTAPVAADGMRRGVDVFNNYGKGSEGVGKGEGVGKVLDAQGNAVRAEGSSSAPGWKPQLPDWLYEGSSSNTIPSPGEGGGGGSSSSYSSSTPSVRPTPRTAEELQHSQNISEMARLLGGQGSSLYNVSNPLYSQAADYYGQILSGNKAAAAQAIAPEAEQIAELNAGRLKGIQNSGVRGGARDEALAESSRQAHGEIAGLIPKARQNAAQAGGALALSGMNLGTQQESAGAGLYSDLLGKGQQDRQFGDTLQQQNAQLALQEKLGMRGMDLQQMGMQLQEKLGMRGLDLQAMTSMNSLQLQRELGMMNINLSQQQVDLLKQEMRNKTAEAGGQAIGNIGSMLIQALPTVMGLFKGGNTTTTPTPDTSGGYSSGGTNTGSYDPRF